MPAIEYNDERKERRVISVYRTCYVGTDDQVQFAILRNLSDGGAQIEGEISAPVGSTVYYAVDEGTRIEAEIRWKKDGRIGLVNRETRRVQPASFPRRAVRLPLRHEANAWVDGRRFRVRIANISQQGARVVGLPEVPVGKPIVLQMGSIEIQSVTARWVGRMAAGVRFPRPLPIAQLNEILRLQSGQHDEQPDQTQADSSPREVRTTVLDAHLFNGRAA
jgi:hypothetical protein